nr:hypothetical protein [Mycobacterium sp. E3298]
MPSYYDYIDAIRKDSSVTYKIELLDKNENVIEDITKNFLDGSVNISYQNGSRRSANLSLTNFDNNYTPNYKGKIWANTKIRISSGLNDTLNSNGIFCLVEPEINSYFTETSASLNLNDKWSLLDGTLSGTLKADYIIPLGTNIADSVRAIIVNEVADVKPPIIIPTDVVTPYTLTMDRGDNLGDMLIKLAEMISYECFYDKNGNFRFQPVGSDDIKPSSWDFSTNEVTYLGSSRKFDFSQMKNSVYVYGDNINGSQIMGSAQDTFIFSPTYVGLIGERVKLISDDIIYNNDLANQRAAYELRKAIIVQESTTIDCVCIYHLDVGNIVTIEDSGNNLNRDRYIVSNIDLPLNYDSTMKINVWKNRPLE